MPAKKSRRKKNPAHTDYERSLKLLYKSDYAKAQTALEALAQKYPDEKQVMDRARMLLKVCEENRRQTKKVVQNGVELYDLGVFEHNCGHFVKAIDLFERALKRVSNETDEAAVYGALAASFARTGAADKALESLQKAIKGDEIYRHHARHDSDFNSMGSNERFKELVAISRDSS